MAKRKPQINFQVDEPMKLLYEEAKIAGHWVTRFCAAGFLTMIENPSIRMQALNRLRDWEGDYAGASAEEIRDFVQNAELAAQAASQRPARGLKTPAKRKRAKRARG
jgi:hypothetical protein